MMVETTVIVMFHRIFLTKVDKAFHIKCFYIEADYRVSHSLHISSLPTTELYVPQEQVGDEVLVPTCKYEVTRNRFDGDLVKYAAVGDRVYHKWTCQGENENAYCMTVHSCSVDDGQGMEQKILDERGS
ncbi:unnamed protein product, partial [Anisakis simplex]|uniref:ZP domain-containing protein n=1 Tax=Anisakis simplex TaxID=6269 RepID=A0A0M3KD08_ANISI